MGKIKFGFTAQQMIDDGRISQEEIDALKVWLSTQSYPELTDEQIVLFLMSCCREEEPTQATIKAFFSTRNGSPAVFDNRKMNRVDIQYQLNTVEFCVFPERTDDGCAVVFHRLYDTNFQHYDMEPSMKLLFMTLDAAIHDYPPKGLVILFDMKGVGLMHLTRVRLGLVQVFAQYLQEGLPVKLKEIHILNSVYFLDKVLGILKPFVKKDVMEMVMAEPAIKFGFDVKQLIAEGRLAVTDIDLLKPWLSTQKIPKLTEEQLALFLLSCDLDQEATKATIKAYFAVKKASPAVFDRKNVTSPEFQKALKAGSFCVFPDRTDDGCAVIMYSFAAGYSNWDMATFFALLFMTLDAAVYDSPPKGLIIVVDTQQMGFMYLTKARPWLINTFFRYLQEAAPIKLKCIHVFNTVWFVDRVVALIRPFAKKEVMEQIYFHPSTIDMEWFYENCLPRKNLPEDFGGELSSVAVLHQQNIEKLTAMQSYFDAEELQRRTVS